MKHKILIVLVGAMLPVAPGLRAQDIGATLENAALAKIVAGDAEGAAVAVGARNTAKNGTLSWYQQSSLVLVRRAYILKAKLDYDGSREAAAAAIKILEHGFAAKSSEARSTDKAQTCIQLAQIHDDLLGERATARSYVELALELAPNNEQAKEALARYDEDDAKLERLVRRGKKG
jgi:hypothetical protein